MSDLVNRLRGEYRIPITDGLGAAGGEEPENDTEFVRTFPSTPIQVEAANEIERLRADFAKLRLGICDHATDTVWVDERGTTAVDFISIILDDGDWYNEIYLPSKEAE